MIDIAYLVNTSYLLTSVVVGAALICGMILGYIAKEELKPGRKYLEFFQGAMLAFIIFFMLFPYMRILTAAVVMVVAMFFIGKAVESLKADYIIYLVLAAVLFLSTRSFFVLISSLIFLYSLPTGSLFMLRKVNKGWVMLLSLAFIVISNALFLLF